MIGIDPNSGLVYEGASLYGHGIWPSPFVSIASIISTSEDWLQIPTNPDLSHSKLVFREDSFDPVTRIRRGRLYKMGQFNPQQWHVQSHPAYKIEYGNRDNQDRFIKPLMTFDSWVASPEIKNRLLSIVITLGIQDAITAWNIVGIERISTREDLITLRARSAFGTIPELSPFESSASNLDKQEFKSISDALNNLASAAYRMGPESVIDRCRDIVQLCLSISMAKTFSDQSLRTRDIGELIKKLESSKDEKPVLVICIAKMIARLHARAKPNEQYKNEYRLPTEPDAESAIALIGLLIRELGWSIP